jgi:hypothetical protein
MKIHKKNEHLKQGHCIYPTGIFPIAKNTKLRVSQGMSAKKTQHQTTRFWETFYHTSMVGCINK